MPLLLACLPPGVHSAQHVSDVVTIAIGLNLLLPVASSFLKCLLDGVEIDPEKIMDSNFKDRDATSEELTEIAVAAQAIEEEKAKCNPLSWGWWIFDVFAAVAGIAILLSGWVDHIGLWCLLLFVPVVTAIVCSGGKYIRLKRKFKTVLAKTKRQSESRAKSGSAYVKNYTDKCKKALKKHSSAKKNNDAVR